MFRMELSEKSAANIYLYMYTSHLHENDICQQYSASHTASEIIQLAKHIRCMGVSTVVIGSNIIIRPIPRNMKETTYDRKKKKINKI
jgi:hypothetical protein